MNISIQQIVSDLINKPGLGMFAWMCIVFFVIGFLVFLWALKSGQMDNIEDTKFDMLNDDLRKDKEVKNVK